MLKISKGYLLPLGFVFLLIVGFSTNLLQINPQSSFEKDLQTNTATKNCIPTFADGGGPYYQPNSPFRNKIAPEVNNGEKLVTKGKILHKDCQTQAMSAILDIWQANESGNYDDLWYRGRVRSDNEGNFSFETVVPKGYGEGTGYRPPHIHFKVFINNTEVITSQMFFPEARGKAGFDEAYIMQVESTDEGTKTVHNAYHNIILPI